VITDNSKLTWKRYEEEVPGRPINAIWTDTPGTQDKQYVVETPPKVLERCIVMTTDPGDLVLDLTCGSGAMPFQAETWGRRWIAIDVAQVSIAIARERLITNTYPYHMLKDSPEGAKLDHEMEQALLPPEERTPLAEQPPDHYKHDPQRGFVTERQLRVSAATLAYGHGDEEPIRHPDRTVKVNNRTRVASPFTVESDSPYRSMTPGEQNGHHQDVDVETILQTTGFTLPEPEGENPVIKRITNSLETSGIGQPGKGRYKVENLAPSDVMDVTHTGTLIAPDRDRHPAFFYIGREDEVISAVQTRNAATAIANVDPSCRHLVMVGFGRDGDAHSVGRYRPGMTILQVQTNRDLQLPWLKEDKTDTAFTIISEPEVRLHQSDNGRVQLEVVGLNCFNPKLGAVEVGDARQMMGIMVDTEYDTESFRARLINVRQVGRNQRTLKNLRAAFNREIDPEKWEQMLTTKTIPFELPEPGVKIAVKVIDQTGMEHMTVIDDPRKESER
jgi:adenine-specific DNA-methyltransferase